MWTVLVNGLNKYQTNEDSFPLSSPYFCVRFTDTSPSESYLSGFES